MIAQHKKTTSHEVDRDKPIGTLIWGLGLDNKNVIIYKARGNTLEMS